MLNLLKKHYEKILLICTAKKWGYYHRVCALYNLSDDQVEHQIRDRLSFMHRLVQLEYLAAASD